MAHENGDKQRPINRWHVQGMLDETDPLNFAKLNKTYIVFAKFKYHPEY